MNAPAFIFATGIESSIPTIGGGTTRIDQMAQCGHYRHWRTRRIRPVGDAYRKLIERWRNVLPTESVCLRMPIVMPSEYAMRIC